MELELVKVVCVSVVAVREGDKVVNEIEGTPTPCYSLEQMQAFMEQAEVEVAQKNAEQNGNRKQRRARKPKAEAAAA